MRERPRAQEKDELEPLLRLRVGLVLDEHDAAPLPDCLSRVAKDGDEIVHELRRSQSDFLRHPQLIASGAGSEHSPKASPRYLSGRFAGSSSEGSAVGAPLETRSPLPGATW
jgi:hypothetical protein